MKRIPIIASSAMILTILGLHASSIIPAESPAPVSGAGGGHDGSSGFRPADSPQTLRYPAPELFGAYGTFSAWVNLDDPASASGTIFSAGTPDTGWLFLQIADGKLSFLLQRGVKPYSGEGECYLNASTPIDGWAPDSWHHITIVWDARGPGQSLAALFIDGQIVEERNTVSLVEGWGPDVLFIGSSSANAASPRIAGSLDKVAIFPFALPPDQVTQMFAGEPAGASLFIDFESGFDAVDLRSSPDDAAARAASRAQWAQ